MPGGGSDSRISGSVPWRMWGETQNVEVASSGGLVTREEKQILRINYARPESWCFVLGAEMLETTGQSAVGTFVTVSYKISLGVGRSVITIPDWHVFTWDYNAATISTLNGTVLWTNSVVNRIRAEGNGTDPPQFDDEQWLDTIVAQDIQLAAIVAVDSAGEPTRAKVAVHAYFAPKTHIRPEWFIREFPGNEHKGT
jgi:hypothetical protein